MSQHEKVVVIAALLLANGSTAEADPVTVTNPSTVSLSIPASYTLSFAPIVDADELISNSGASVGGAEGGSLTLDVDYVGGATQRIFSGTFSPAVEFNFSDLHHLIFGLGTINGLTFGATPICCGGHLFIPQGATFTFNAQPVVGSAPEPSSIALVVAGAAGLLNWRRRRTGAAAQVATSE